MATVLFIFSHVSVVVSNIEGKSLRNSDLDGTVTKAVIGKMHGMKHVCRTFA